MVLGNVTVKVDADISAYNRKMLEAAAATRALNASLDGSRNQMAGLVQAGLAVGPALVSIGAAGVPAIAGLTNQLAFATAGAGVTALAFQGIGDALKALNTQAIDPTDAHLKALATKMNQLGPAGQQFVKFLQQLRPEFQSLQDVSQAGLFPGLERGITDLFDRGPEIERLFFTLSKTIGDLLAEAGENLAGPEWNDFFTFLQTQAQPTLVAMGRTLGNFAQGFAEVWMAFQPLSTDFSNGFLEMSRDFAQWADGLSSSQDFQDFLAYVERVGPKAADAIGSITDAFVALLGALAPVGEASLPILEQLFDILAAFLRTPLAPPILALATALGALSTLKRIANFAQFKAMFELFRNLGVGRGLGTAVRDLPAATRNLADFSVIATDTATKAERNGRKLTSFSESLKATGKAAGFAGGLAFAMSDLDDKMGLTNTTSLALAGSIAGPWGAAIGGGIGLVLDFAHANDDLGDRMAAVDRIVSDSSVSIADKLATVNKTITDLEEARRQLRVSGASVGVGVNTDDIDDRLKDLNVTKKELTESAQEQAFAEAGLTTAMARASKATRDETFAMLENIRVKNQAKDATLGAFGAETDFRRAMKAAKEQADKSNAGIKGNSEAALANRDALENVASAWNKVADAGGKSEGDLRRQREAFIRLATGMGVPIEEARRLARELLHIPSVNPKVKLSGVEGALEQIRHVKDRLISLDGTTAQTFVQLKESVATGGRVPPGYAVGGVVPGVPPSDPSVDNVLAYGSSGKSIMVRSGEWIINEPQSRKNDPWLAAINRGLNLGPYPVFAPHYNEGGRVDGGRSAVFGAGQQLRLHSGALEIRGGKAYVSGIAELVVASNESYKGTTRRGRVESR